MAISTLRSLGNLDSGMILAPERYHPGRELNIGDLSYRYLSELVVFAHPVISPRNAAKIPRLYVVDTGDSTEGHVTGLKGFTTSINSSKKPIEPGDVIISGLRPYLRQIVYVDNDLPAIQDAGTRYVCSTEFYVLRPIDTEPIAFVGTFLLSERVQSV